MSIKPKSKKQKKTVYLLEVQNSIGYPFKEVRLDSFEQAFKVWLDLEKNLISTYMYKLEYDEKGNQVSKARIKGE